MRRTGLYLWLKEQDLEPRRRREGATRGLRREGSARAPAGTDRSGRAPRDGREVGAVGPWDRGTVAGGPAERGPARRGAGRPEQGWVQETGAESSPRSGALSGVGLSPTVTSTGDPRPRVSSIGTLECPCTSPVPP